MNAAPDLNRRMALDSLDAQLSLAPYMIAAFAVGLCIFVPFAAAAGNSGWLAACMIGFAVAWAAFYFASDWMKGHPEASIETRTRTHVLGGLLWSATLLPMTALADGAGPLREPLLLFCVAAAATIAFFTATHLPSLLLVGPAAAAPPLVALHMQGGADGLESAALGGMALSLAMSLILNRTLRRQFALSAEREALTADRSAALAVAEQLARSKSDLIATLSGEIRTGLAGVEQVLAAAAAGRRSRMAPTADQLNAAHDAARDLLNVLDVTLTSEAAEAGRLTLSPEPFDPLRLCLELTAQNRAAAAARGLDLSQEIGPDTWGMAMGDRLRVRQVVDILLGNAVRYTLRGRVELRLVRVDESIRLEVADTGPGLSPEELAIAFEPFQRVERTAAGVPGAGLGLSLARRLVRLMGAELRAESAVGVGSRFWFDLPFQPAAEDVLETTASLPRTALRVLLAETNALEAAHLRSSLEGLGHKVVHVQEAARAKRLLARAEIDALVLAADQPELKPAELTAAARAAQGRPGVIAVCSAQADGADALGADAIVRRRAGAAALARAFAEAASLRPDLRAAA